jgi:CheY-like chemotaxis protein
MTGKRVLVIEDEFLVAVEIQAQLRDAGVLQSEHASTEKEALRRIAEGGWDAAVVDANLNGKGIKQVAAALLHDHIPFVIVTGYNRDSLPTELANTPMLSKPLAGQRLAQELASFFPPNEYPAQL